MFWRSIEITHGILEVLDSSDWVLKYGEGMVNWDKHLKMSVVLRSHFHKEGECF